MSDAATADLFRAHLETVTNNYSAALQTHGYSALLVHAGSLIGKSRFDDQDYPFKPTPTFSHFTPLLEPDAWLLHRPGKKPRILSTYRAGFWDGAPAAVPEWVADKFDYAQVSADKLVAELPSGQVAWIGEDASRAQALGLQAEACNPQPLIEDLHKTRTIKSDYERECLAAATQRAVAGHRQVFSRFRADPLSELELHLEYLRATRQDDSETPYKNIVALCSNSAVLHHVHYGRDPAPANRSLLVDAGAIELGYACDITRTDVVGSGDAVSIFRGLIDGLDQIQLQLCDGIRPGLAYESLHDLCHELIAPLLVSSGILDASPEEIVASGATRKFFPHGLGHSLGIQVHDVGCKSESSREDNPFLRNTSTIEAGQVFTIEPGLYFIPALLEELRQLPIGKSVNWSTVAELTPLGGIRIEDNICVFDNRIRNLTREVWPGGEA